MCITSWITCRAGCRRRAVRSPPVRIVSRLCVTRQLWSTGWSVKRTGLATRVGDNQTMRAWAAVTAMLREAAYLAE
jgi:hypothetical protein